MSSESVCLKRELRSDVSGWPKRLTALCMQSRENGRDTERQSSQQGPFPPLGATKRTRSTLLSALALFAPKQRCCCCPSFNRINAVKPRLAWTPTKPFHLALSTLSHTLSLPPSCFKLFHASRYLDSLVAGSIAAAPHHLLHLHHHLTTSHHLYRPSSSIAIVVGPLALIYRVLAAQSPSACAQYAV